MKKSSLSWLLAIVSLLGTVTYFFVMFIPGADNSLDWGLGIILLWTILLPVISVIPHFVRYPISYLSPIFGVFLLIIMWIDKYGFMTSNAFEFVLLAGGAAWLIVTSLHYLTRERTIIWKFQKSSLTRTSIAVLSTLFLVMGMLFINPSIDIPFGSQVVIFSLFLLSYVGSSLLYVNQNYRSFCLSFKLKISHVENEMEKIWDTIVGKYPKKEKDLDLMKYYFEESIESFREGDLEKSFIWGYKLIREPTIVDPRQYVNYKREGKPSLSDVRDTLMHSRRKGKHTDTARIRQYQKNLFNHCLDLIEREFLFLKEISRNSYKTQASDINTLNDKSA